MTYTLKFVLEKETPGSLRYMEVDEKGERPKDYLVGTLYLRKNEVEGKPQGLSITIETVG